MRDPYEALGVGRTASEKDIKTAFRKLAKTYHPDTNKDPSAKVRFNEANQAYEIVGDPKKRAQFDRGEIDADGKEKAQGFEGFGGGFGRGTGADGFETFSRGFGGGRRAAQGAGAEDILSQMFGGGFQSSGGRSQADPFADLRGGGMGGGPGQQRPASGPVKGDDRKVQLTVSLREMAEGKATVRLDGKSIAVSIPADLTEGQTIRLKGKGKEGPAGNGDALITLHIADHPTFKREGANLRAPVTVPFATAVLGGKLRVPTLTGAVNVTVPEWTRAGQTFRVKGKGLPGKGGTVGDILAVAAIDLPDAKDDRLIEAAKALSPETA